MNKKIFFVTFVLFLIFVFIILSMNFNIKYFGSPDENTNLFFIKNYASTGNFYYNDSLNFYLNGTVHPRASISYRDKIVPTGFSGMLIYYGLYELWFNNSYNFLSLILAFIAFIYIYLNLNFFINKSKAFIISILIISNFVILYWLAKPLMNNILDFVFLIVGFFYFFKFDKENSKLYLFLSAFFLFSSFLIRNEQILFIMGGFVIYFLIGGFKKYKYYIFTFLLIFSFFMTTALTINFLKFENPLSLSAPNTQLNQINSNQNILSIVLNLALPSAFNINYLIRNSFNYLFLILLPVSLFLFPLVFTFIFKEKIKLKSLHFLLIFFFLYSIIFYMTGYYYGYSPLDLGSSYLRYNFLFVTVLLSGCYLYMFREKNKKILILVLSLLFILSIINYNNIYANIQRSNGYERNLNDIKNTVTPNSIVLTHLYDKILFPDIRVMTFGPDFLYNNTGSDFHAAILNEAYNKGLDVYIIKDKDYFNIESINRQLSYSNLTLKLVNVNYGGIYEVQHI